MTIRGRIDLNDLIVLNAVVEAGSFTAAAERLDVAPAKVSVEISRLESQLGITLFNRTTRRVVPTEAGQALHEESGPLVRQLLSAVENIQPGEAEIAGALRVTSTVDHAVLSLAPALARFAELHPKLHVDLRTSDRVSDILSEGIDLAIRLGWLQDSSLRAVKLASLEQYLVASPSYLRKVPHPKTPEGAERLDWLAFSPFPLTWVFTSSSGEVRTINFRTRIKVDSPGALRAMLRHGAGIAVMDQYSVEDDLQSGRLVRLLPNWSLPVGGVFAVLPPGRHVDRKVQAFIDFYKTCLQLTGNTRCG